MISPAAVTQGSLRTSAGRALPLTSTEVHARVQGPAANVLVRQRFHNDTPDPIEAVYAFPLPDGASVHRMLFRIADRVVRAAVEEKAAARRTYEQAKSEGRAATLLEEDQPTLFTLSVANVAPGATIDVELEYQELVTFDDGKFRLVFPMVAPERYRDGPAPSSREKLRPPRAPTGERSPDVAIEVEIQSATSTGPVHDVRCLSHPVVVLPLPGRGIRARLAPSAALANRDFVVEWQVAEEGVRPRVYVERAAGEAGTFLLSVLPSAPDRSADEPRTSMKALCCGNCGGVVTDVSAIREIPGLGAVLPCRYCGAVLTPGTERITRAARPRDVVILVDRSASMRGAIDQARAAVRSILEGLSADDAAQILAFDHDPLFFDRRGGAGWLSSSPELIVAAERFVADLAPRGGTDLQSILERAGAIPLREGRTRVVVLITDAAVGNEGQLLRRVPEILGGAARLFVLGVGRNVDRRLVSRLARAGGGASDVLLGWGDPGETLARFSRRVREAGPVLTDLALWWEGADIHDEHPFPIPPLYAGQPVHVLGRFKGTGPSRLVITGRTLGGAAFRQELGVDLPAASEEVPGLGRLWARRHVEALAEKAAQSPVEAPAMRSHALELSLRYSIVGPLTSLVAVDSEVSVKPEVRRAGKLVVVRGPDAGTAFLLDRPRLVLGRHRSSDFTLTDTHVSRHHIEVVVADAGFIARDLSSTNGILVDGRRSREIELREGMRIEIGQTILRFELDRALTFEYVPTRRVQVSLPEGEGQADFEAPEAMAEEAAPVLRSALHSTPRPPLPGAPAPSSPAAPPLEMRSILASAAPRAAALPPPSLAARPGPPPAPGVASMAMPTPTPPPAMASSAPVSAESMSARPTLVTASRSSAPPAPSVGRPPPAPLPPQAAHRAPSVPELPAQPRIPEPGGSLPQSPIEAAGSDPYPEHELLWLRDRIRGELDLVFLVDATSSMGPFIDEAKRRLIDLIDALHRSPLCRSLRLGLVSYRDHAPQEASYASRVIPLTSDTASIRSAVLELVAAGGGDGPEAVTDGLADVVRLDWRSSAVRAVVWFGDAPPHGVEPRGDAFPNGCPCGRSWYAQAESCREMGISVYAIGCLPVLRKYVRAEAVYRTVARATRGMFLPLREAALLVPLIAGAAANELDKQRLDEHVAALWMENAPALRQSDEPERARWIAEALEARGVRVREMGRAEELEGPAPLRFREVLPEDVEGSLERLRLAGRLAA
ncbi:MAG TPA: VIT domain-containing protein [Polyangiaceae bacterium]|nr:VIT domain-containing protein [Polyangiaceae bacterium]